VYVAPILIFVIGDDVDNDDKQLFRFLYS